MSYDMPRNFAEFVNGYIDCALWASTQDDDAGTPMNEDYSIEDFAPETIVELTDDATTFYRANLVDVDAYVNERDVGYDYAGHDFWLTRNGHGVGYWDRGLGDLGDRLSKAAETEGESDLYVGDDGLVYVT